MPKKVLQRAKNKLRNPKVNPPKKRRITQEKAQTGRALQDSIQIIEQAANQTDSPAANLAECLEQAALAKVKVEQNHLVAQADLSVDLVKMADLALPADQMDLAQGDLAAELMGRRWARADLMDPRVLEVVQALDLVADHEVAQAEAALAQVAVEHLLLPAADIILKSKF